MNSRKGQEGILPRAIIQSYKHLYTDCMMTWWGHSTPSNISLLRSHQITRIKLNRTAFHIAVILCWWYFPCQQYYSTVSESLNNEEDVPPLFLRIQHFLPVNVISCFPNVKLMGSKFNIWIYLIHTFVTGQSQLIISCFYFES